jgi:cytochrome c
MPNSLSRRCWPRPIRQGQQVFQKCASCHTINQGGANGVGPNLYGIVGDEVAKGRGGFAFSAGLAAKGGKWDFSNLNDWLKNPRAYADGTKMTFAGLESAEDRAAVMVYLNAQGSNKPLPAVPAAKAVRQRLRRVTPHPPPTARPLRRNLISAIRRARMPHPPFAATP